MLLILILCVTWIGYKPMKYGDYIFPDWANIMGWVVTAASVSFIPIVAFYKFFTTEGSMTQVKLSKFIHTSLQSRFILKILQT